MQTQRSQKNFRGKSLLRLKDDDLLKVLEKLLTLRDFINRHLFANFLRIVSAHMRAVEQQQRNFKINQFSLHFIELQSVAGMSEKEF